MINFILLILLLSILLLNKNNTINVALKDKKESFTEKSEYEIIPSNKISSTIKNKMTESIGLEYKNPDFMFNWGYFNTLFIIKYEEEFYGTIGIIKENDFLILSQLFVNPIYRKKGISKILLNYGNNYIKNTGLNKSKLYCEPKMLNYYIKLGWSIEKFDGIKYLMYLDI
jgi:hypothetical protein